MKALNPSVSATDTARVENSSFPEVLRLGLVELFCHSTDGCKNSNKIRNVINGSYAEFLGSDKEQAQMLLLQ